MTIAPVSLIAVPSVAFADDGVADDFDAVSVGAPVEGSVDSTEDADCSTDAAELSLSQDDQ